MKLQRFAWGMWATVFLPSLVLAQTYSKTETIEYHDDLSLWVLGQVKRTTTDGSETSKTDYGWNALPWKTFSFGKLQQTLSYDATSAVGSGQLGTLKTVMDGSNHVTTLTLWKRGIPQKIKYPVTPEFPSGAEQTAGVNDVGWIEWVEDENRAAAGASGYRTCYGYDAMGRINLITYPSETTAGVCDSSAWNPTTITFAAAGNAAAYGMPAGHWRQTTLTGNGRKILILDALWRPVVEQTVDLGDASGTRSEVIKRYNASGQLEFQSYPMNTNALANYADITLKGVRTEYDALDRVTSVSQDSELGLLTTLTEYLPGFKTRTTPPKGAAWQTTTSYLVYDQPTTNWPLTIVHPEGAFTDITRDVFGEPTELKRRNSDSSVVLSRKYVYRPDWHTLCKTIEPETGATVMDFDGAGNLGWSASGLNLPSTTSCNLTEGFNSGRRTQRSYDARNRIKTLVFPDGRGDQSWTYTPDGLPAQIITYNATGNANPVHNAFAYNKRRMLAGTGETITWPGFFTYGIGYGYNRNSHQTNLVYPSGLVVDYAPNALGQPTKAGTFAREVSYYPNGALKQFVYGNGIVHDMSQNLRQLPEQSSDGAAGHFQLDLAYQYDGNGNVSEIADFANGLKIRSMTYDGLDRLTQTTSSTFGTASYSYDVLDNLTALQVTGGQPGNIRNHAYVYSEIVNGQKTNRLSNITNGAGGPTVIGLGYDLQGNVNNKNGQGYLFDYGNRLREATNIAGYAYDGFGHRVLASNLVWFQTFQYSQAGQLLYTSDGRSSYNMDHIYLAGSLIAERKHPFGNVSAATVSYQHTDALGTPIAVTNASKTVIQTSEYEPYGKLANRVLTDGPGYTGHFQDATTGLTYMQQRYYDPAIGRFLSVDPVTANSATGANFNRYWYANDNPYKFTDPDGRATWPTPSNFNVDMSQRVPNEVSNAWRQAEEVNLPKTVYVSGTLADAAGGGLVGGRLQGASATAAASLKEGGTFNATGPQALLTTPAGAVRLEATRNGIEATQLKAQVVGGHAGTFGWEGGVSSLSTASNIDNMDTKTTITVPWGSISWGRNQNGNGWAIGISVSKLSPALSYVRTEENIKSP